MNKLYLAISIIYFIGFNDGASPPKHQRNFMLTGRVTLSEGSPTPIESGGTLTAELQDISLPDRPARVVAKGTSKVIRFPVVFGISYSSSQIVDGHTYALKANIRNKRGELLYTNEVPLQVTSLNVDLDYRIEVPVRLVKGKANPSTSGNFVLTGRVTFPEGSPSPIESDGTLTVELQDISLSDRPARVVATGTSKVIQFPVVFGISYSSSQVVDGHTYALKANIRNKRGELLYTNDIPLRVTLLNIDLRDRIEIPVRLVKGRANPSTSGRHFILTGRVTFPEGSPTPIESDGTLTVELQDISLPDRPPKVVATGTSKVIQFPVVFGISYSSNQIVDKHTYALKANIRNENGELLYTNEVPLRVTSLNVDLDYRIEVPVRLAEKTTPVPEKSEWPELVGRNGQEAIRIIKKQTGFKDVITVKEGSVMTTDYRTNRVRIFVDKRGIVTRVPTVG
ncbi:unnamed protein product [Rotaria sp. Silwood1]|nr:unnamed protein product [Rotaria sp. Silwood1]CAF1303035.1 unnamed protein product [Rotaria sp. Silwood1]CAF3789040.1 unnamed protein product [Rotaria sp. Silwood1]